MACDVYDVKNCCAEFVETIRVPVCAGDPSHLDYQFDALEYAGYYGEAICKSCDGQVVHADYVERLEDADPDHRADEGDSMICCDRCGQLGSVDNPVWTNQMGNRCCELCIVHTRKQG